MKKKKFLKFLLENIRIVEHFQYSICQVGRRFAPGCGFEYGGRISFTRYKRTPKARVILLLHVQAFLFALGDLRGPSSLA